MIRPKLLDLYCCQGGAGMGYHRAGFDVTGVDINPQPRYPFEFIQADALEYLREHGHEYDAIHASPPCQGHSDLRHRHKDVKYPNLIPPTRDALTQTSAPWVMENVEGAPLVNSVTLCGTMFGLCAPDGSQLLRHRLFETNWFLFCGLSCNHKRKHAISVNGTGAPCGPRSQVITVVGHTPVEGSRNPEIGKRRLYSTDDARAAMGIEWMGMKGLSQAIPPPYTEFIGRQLIAQIGGAE